MFEWIEEVVSQGIRRPGYPADRSAEEFIFGKFRELGLQSLRFEPVESSFWKDSHARLAVIAHQQTVEIECFPVPLSEPTVIEGSLVRWDPADPASVSGKVAVYELRFGSLPDEFPVLSRRGEASATSPSPKALIEAGWAFDPDHTFVEGRHRLPFADELQDTMEPAIAAGAVGFVGVLRGYPSGGCEYYVPYDGTPRPIPGVYVSERDGDRLLEVLEEDDTVRASIEVVAERGTTTSRNVVGELPGADDDWGHHRDTSRCSMGISRGRRNRDCAVAGSGGCVGLRTPERTPALSSLPCDRCAYVRRRRHALIHRAAPPDDGSDSPRSASRACRTRQPASRSSSRRDGHARYAALVVYHRGPDARTGRLGCRRWAPPRSIPYLDSKCIGSVPDD